MSYYTVKIKWDDADFCSFGVHGGNYREAFAAVTERIIEEKWDESRLTSVKIRKAA